MHTAEESYRPDIDGLRAVAVLAVVAFHAFPQWLPGGYVGVDVFFVISGFLISGQLMAAAAGGQISFAGFYARRIRRIFPALLVVLAAVAVAGWWVLLPGEWVELRRHIGASAIFANNILLWSEAGYFDGPSELKPLLHLWSLGVEEQFYLIWPVLIWWWWRRDLRWTVAIALVVAASFAINVITVANGATTAAFFLPHTRLWQLGGGALLAAFARKQIAVRSANALSMAGVLLILFSFAALSRSTAYPGWAALGPTLGAVLVIAAGRDAAVNRTWLSMRPMVFVGLISYPLYLWHWPILSLLQVTELGQVPPGLKVAAIAASVVLASITYLFIEQPARRSMTPATMSHVAPLLASMIVIGMVMEIAISTDWLTPPARTALQIDAPVRADLNTSVCRRRFPGLGEYCQQFHPDLTVTTALLGDSHAAHFLPGLGAMMRRNVETAVHLGQTGCPPLIGIERLNQAGDGTCTRVNRAVIDAVLADDAVVKVWLSFRGAAAVTGIVRYGGGISDLFRLIGTNTTNEAAIRAGLRATIKELQDGGKRVGVILQVPELSFRVDECTGRPFSFAHGPARKPCTMPLDVVMERQSGYRRVVSDMQREFGIAVYDPLSSLCDERECHAVAEGLVLYFDDNHLGVFGSSWALRNFGR
jgi:peptidoglycan/LPS O-acetylase OafA/YrhL